MEKRVQTKGPPGSGIRMKVRCGSGRAGEPHTHTKLLIRRSNCLARLSCVIVVPVVIDSCIRGFRVDEASPTLSDGN